MAESFLGTPAITMPGMMSIPEIKLVSRTHQSAIAKIGLAAYDARTMRLLGDGGMSLSRSTDNNWYFMGVGPHQNGTIHREIERGIPSTLSQPYNELPTHVAFAEPQAPAQTQLANEGAPQKQADNPVQPASSDSSQPGH
jgi:hypothetical protein